MTNLNISEHYCIDCDYDISDCQCQGKYYREESFQPSLDAIVDEGRGQVAVVLRGREITFLARSRDGQSIKRGTPVAIVAKTANIVTVDPIE